MRVLFKLFCARKWLPVFFISLLSLGVHAQSTSRVSGKVTNGEGEELSGVSVTVKGTTDGTVTQSDGSFSINVPEKGGTLVFSFLGFTKEVAVIGGSTLNISLITDNRTLDEVLAVGYGTVKRSDLTGAVSSVSSKDLKAVPMANLAQGLQGRAPGVVIRQTDSSPGGNVSIRVRGGNSITAGNDVLYIVDGFVGADNINNINPQDIESVEILKDASASAIYGARAANGVVLITTKRGKSGKTVVEFDSYAGKQSFVKQLELMDADQYAAFLLQARGENTTNPELTHDWRLIGFEDTNTDWQKEILRRAPIQNYSLRLSGGSEKTKYMVSGEYFDQRGIVLNSGFERLAIRTNLDFEVNKRIDFGINLSLSQGNRSTSNPLFSVGQAPPGFPLDFQGVNYFNIERQRFVNPYLEALNNFNEQKRFKVLGNAFANYKITPTLTFRTTIGLDMTYRVENSYANRFTEAGMELEGGLSGRAGVNRGNYSNILNENTLTFNKVFNGRHALNVVAGFTAQMMEGETLGASDRNFEIEQLSYYNLGKSDPSRDQLQANLSYSNEGILSYLGRINYTLNDRYLFTVSARTDGSSKFGENNRYAFFPSGAFAWKVTSEPFMQHMPWVSNLKLRTSLGITGNQGIAPYSKQATITSTQTAFGTSYRQGSLANPNLKWETTAQTDIGIDLGLFDNRVNIIADYYYKKTKDLLFTRQLSGSTGFGSNLENFGKIQNKGFEFAVNYRHTFGGFSWNSDLNYSMNRSKILDLPVDRVFYNSLILLEGEELGLFYGLIYDGIIYPEDMDGLYTSTLRSQRPGEFKFVDIDGDGVLDGDKDRAIIGNPNPRFVYGWNNSFAYRNFELSVFLQGVYGNDIYYSNLNFLDLLGTRGRNVFADVANPENVYPSPTAIYPQIGYDREDDPNSSQVKDGSYLRARNITLAYNLSERIRSRLKVSGARVYLSANNAFTITNYFGLDPEVSGSGSLLNGYDTGNAYPSSKSFLIGINLTL